MATLVGFDIINYRSFHNITLGFVDQRPLSPLTVVIGKNGSGKSTLIDAFGFLADCLKVGVEEACHLRERGGFGQLRSTGKREPIVLQLWFIDNNQFLRYEIQLQLDQAERPFVLSELLDAVPFGSPHNLFLLSVKNGEGFIRQDKANETNKKNIKLSDPRKLAIATFGSLEEYPIFTSFRNFLEGWHLSYFSPKAAREITKAGPQKHLNWDGSNLGNVVQYMEREYGPRFQEIIRNIGEKIPGITNITTHRDDISKNLYLLFHSQGFTEPFTHYQMSDGTLKLFSYLLLLENPDPPPLLCIEEPENGLYHQLLESLASDFRTYAQRGNTQVIITTHQPYLVDALSPEEVWVLDKGADGFSTIKKASEIPYIKNMVAEGQTLGSLWYSNYLNQR